MPLCRSGQQRGVREVADHGGVDLPDVAGVFADGAVGGELAHPGDVEERLAVPRGAVAVGGVDGGLGVAVRLQVGEVDVDVAGAGDAGDDRPEDVFVAAREV